MARFVTAYSKKTGEKQRVPEHWLGHEVLGKDFSKTPRQKAADRNGSPFPEGDPSEVWKGDELKAYAEARGFDLGAAKTKAEMVAAITDATDTTTPASGEQEN